MNTIENTLILTVGETEGHCPIGEIVGQKTVNQRKFPSFLVHVFEVKLPEEQQIW